MSRFNMRYELYCKREQYPDLIYEVFDNDIDNVENMISLWDDDD